MLPPHLHRTSRVLPVFLEEVSFLNLLWLHAIHSKGDRNFGLLRLQTDSEACSSDIKEERSMIALFDFTFHQVHLSNVGYTIMENTVEYLPRPVRLARPPLSSPLLFQYKSFQNLYDHVYKTFPGEEHLKYEEECVELAPVINIEVPGVDKRDCGSRISRCTRVTELLIYLFETAENICATWRYAVQDVWLGWLVFIVDLDSGRKYRIKTPKSGGSYLLTGKSCKAQAGHIDVAATKVSSSAKLAIVEGSQIGKLYVGKETHNYVLYLIKEKKQMASVLALRPINPPPFSVTFLGTYIWNMRVQSMSGIITCATTYMYSWPL